MAALRVHFLNVGRGDCTVIEFPSGRVGIVDMDNLETFDEDTAREMLQEYQTSYLVARLRGLAGPDLREFLKRYAPFTDPLVYYDMCIGKSKGDLPAVDHAPRHGSHDRSVPSLRAGATNDPQLLAHRSPRLQFGRR